MEKIEPKHLAPYLPYELKGQMKHKDNKTATLRGVGYRLGKTVDFNLDGLVTTCGITNFIPILRPLSDLHKYVEELNDIYGDCICYFEIEDNKVVYYEAEHEYEKHTKNVFTMRTVPYYVYEFLIERHFDVFGLNDKGLAIDINTLT